MYHKGNQSTQARRDSNKAILNPSYYHFFSLLPLLFNQNAIHNQKRSQADPKFTFHRYCNAYF